MPGGWPRTRVSLALDQCRSSRAERVGPEGSEPVGRDGEGVCLVPAPVSSVQTLEASELAGEEHGRCAHQKSSTFACARVLWADVFTNT